MSLSPHVYITEVENLCQKMKQNEVEIEKLILDIYDNYDKLDDVQNIIFIDIFEYDFSRLAWYYSRYCYEFQKEIDFFLVDILLGLHNLDFSPIVVDNQEYYRFDCYCSPRCSYNCEIQNLISRCDLNNLETKFNLINQQLLPYFGINCDFDKNEVYKIKEIINFCNKCLKQNKDILYIIEDI